VDAHTGYEAHVDMIAVRLGSKWVGGGYLEFVDGLEKGAFGFGLEVLVGGFFGDEVRVADNAAGKHTVVGDFLAFGALGFAFFIV